MRGPAERHTLNGDDNRKLEYRYPQVVGSDPSIGDQVCKTGPPFPMSTTLPNVIIMGDSVSIGYTPWVASAMASTAFVQ
jgi:hypothetical protein